MVLFPHSVLVCNTTGCPLLRKLFHFNAIIAELKYDCQFHTSGRFKIHCSWMIKVKINSNIIIHNSKGKCRFSPVTVQSFDLINFIEWRESSVKT